MIRPCPTTVECRSEFGVELFGNGDNPFLNLSIENPCVGPQCWVPPPNEYFTANGRCCNGILKFAYGDTQALANSALNTKISTECPVSCPPPPSQSFCADAKCPDGTLITRVCVTSSYQDALTEANRIKAALGKYCPSIHVGFQSGCQCSDGSHKITVYSDKSQAEADSLCQAAIVAAVPPCGQAPDGTPNPVCHTGDAACPNPVPQCCDPCPNPPCNPPPPKPGTFCNSDQECTVYCEDGLPFTKHVPPGTFCDYKTQKAADDAAKQYACQRAAIEIICIRDMDWWPCLWLESSTEIEMSGLGDLEVDIIKDPHLQWITLEQLSNTRFRLSGTPEDPGIFDFTIIVSDKFGNAQVKDFSLSIFGVDWDVRHPLPETAVGQCYDHQFAALGPYVAPLVWQFVNIPDGLSHDGNGRIFGTPTTAGDFNAFGLFLSDSDEPFRECDYQFQQHIRDCETDIYDGVIIGQISGAGGGTQIFAFPKQICAHTAALHSTNLKVGFACTGSIVATVKKNGVQQAQFIAATVGAFPASLDGQFVALPAQYPPSGGCPEAPAFNDLYTIEFTGGSTGGDCTILFSVTGV